MTVYNTCFLSIYDGMSVVSFLFFSTTLVIILVQIFIYGRTWMSNNVSYVLIRCYLIHEHIMHTEKRETIMKKFLVLTLCCILVNMQNVLVYSDTIRSFICIT